MGEYEETGKIKNRQGVLSKIHNFITRGYGSKEDFRELDKQLRDQYYIDFKNMRHIWEEVSLITLEKGAQVSNRDLKKVLQVLDRLMEKIHHADYGYAGIYDRKGYIREKELIRVLNYDKELEENVRNLGNAINKTLITVKNGKWVDMNTDINKVKNLLSTLEIKLNERETQFRPLEL